MYSCIGRKTTIKIKCSATLEAKQKYRGMFETQKSGNKTSSGEIGLNIRTHASPKVGQESASGGVSVLCWHAIPITDVLLKKKCLTYQYLKFCTLICLIILVFEQQSIPCLFNSIFVLEEVSCFYVNLYIHTSNLYFVTHGLIVFFKGGSF